MDIKERHVKKIFQNKISYENGGLLTIDELSSWLKINVKTLYKIVSRRDIPFIKIGNSLRFDRKIIELWLSERSCHGY